MGHIRHPGYWRCFNQSAPLFFPSHSERKNWHLEKVTPSQITPYIHWDIEALCMKPLPHDQSLRMNIRCLQLLPTAGPERERLLKRLLFRGITLYFEKVHSQKPTMKMNNKYLHCKPKNSTVWGETFDVFISEYWSKIMIILILIKLKRYTLLPCWYKLFAFEQARKKSWRHFYILT